MAQGLQAQERPRVDRTGRARGLDLGGEPEHGPGRHQSADASQRRPHRHAPVPEAGVRGGEPGQRLPSHRVPHGDGLLGPQHAGLADVVAGVGGQAGQREAPQEGLRHIR